MSELQSKEYIKQSIAQQIYVLFSNPKESTRRIKNKFYLFKLRRLLKSNQCVPEFKNINPTNKQSWEDPVLIAIHLFHLDTLPSFLDALKNINGPFHVAVTRPDRPDGLEEQFLNMPMCKKFIFIQTKNKGRDIYPFFRLLEEVDVTAYKAICKIHSKKSPQVNFGDKWRIKSLEILLSNQNICSLIEQMTNDSKIGLVGPKQFFIQRTDSRYNSFWTYKLLKKIDYPYNDVPFFAGTMFWCSPEYAKKILDFEKNYIGYSPINIYYHDGLIEHSIERFFGCFALAQGFKIKTLSHQPNSLQNH